MRHVAAVLASVLAPLGLAAACVDEGVTDLGLAEAGASSGAVAPAACPSEAPLAGETCALPAGTTCAFGSCDRRYAVCAGGVWRLSQNDPGQPVCPAKPPAAGEACPPCWPQASSCLYGSADCSAADASANRAVATCASGRWAIGFEPCRDGGGPDVQGDGGPDAD